MAALSASRAEDKIVSHAWNKDCTQVAICANEDVVRIYEATPESPASSWRLLHTLHEHDKHVSSVDWAPVTNLIVTCSHDRNAYVWNECDNAWQVRSGPLSLVVTFNCLLGVQLMFTFRSFPGVEAQFDRYPI